MTNREICERLLNIHNRLFVEYSLADGLDDFDLDGIGKDISSLLLDLAAPDEHFADAGKMVRDEEEPPVLTYEERGEKTPCPVCGEPAAPIKNKPGLFRCKRCQGLVCAEARKGGDK